MARFQLFIDDQGRALLACKEPVDTDAGVAIKAAFNAWMAANPPELLIAGETELHRVRSIELALPEPAEVD